MTPEIQDWAEVLAHWATAAGFVAVVATLLLGWRNYAQQSAQKRVELYFGIWDRLRSMPGDEGICNAIDTEDWAKLTEIPLRQRHNKLLFFEQVALLVNSKLIHPHVAYYMFGYHAVRCGNRKEFWQGLPGKERYWKLLGTFVEQMRAVERRPWKQRRKKF